MVAAVRERLAGMRAEYETLDTVWFMSGSLFNKCAHSVGVTPVSAALVQRCACTRSMWIAVKPALLRSQRVRKMCPTCGKQSSACCKLHCHKHAGWSRWRLAFELQLVCPWSNCTQLHSHVQVPVRCPNRGLQL